MSSLDYQVSRANPSVVGGVGTTVKYFPRPIGLSIGAAPSTPNANNPTGSLWVPVGPSFGGKQLNIVASGTFGSDSGDPSATVSVGLYPVTGTFAAPVYGVPGSSPATVASTGAITPSYAVEPWALTATLLSDSSAGNADGLLIGSYQASKNGAITAPTTVTSVLTGLDWTNGNPALMKGAVLGFVIGVTFGTSDKSNIARLTEFTISTIE
jgi:hypothetical protein